QYRTAGAAEAALQSLVDAKLGYWDCSAGGPGRPPNMYVHGAGGAAAAAKLAKTEEITNNAAAASAATPAQHTPAGSATPATNEVVPPNTDPAMEVEL
ncbi:MAG: hypothetical protein ACP5O1_12945, partial [Phycisphaerae bacterium]